MLTGIVFDIAEILGLIVIFFIDLSCIDPGCKVSLMASLVLAAFVVIFFRRLAKGVLVFTSAWVRVLAEFGLFQVSVLRRIVFLERPLAFEASDINFSHS